MLWTHAFPHPDSYGCAWACVQVMGLKFKDGVKRVDRTNARVAYVSDDMTAPERKLWEALFEEIPEMLTAEERWVLPRPLFPLQL